MLVGTMLAYGTAPMQAYGTGPILAYDIGPILNGVIIPLYRRRLENDMGAMLAYGTSPMQAYGTGPILAYDIGPILNGVIIPLYRRPSAANGRRPAIDAGPIPGRLSVSDWADDKHYKNVSGIFRIRNFLQNLISAGIFVIFITKSPMFTNKR